jgi:hypothetical protein
MLGELPVEGGSCLQCRLADALDAKSLAIALGPPVGMRSETHPQSLRAAGAQSAWYRRTGHQTCG